jgi:protein-disulfide isomerase
MLNHLIGHTGKFNACLESGKYTGKVLSDSEETERFGISGTPGTFVNDRFVNGAVTYDELKSIIDEKLTK